MPPCGHLTIYSSPQVTLEHLATNTISLVGGPGQDLRNFQVVPIPILSVLTYSTSSPHDILKVSKILPITCPLGGSNVMSCLWWVYSQDFSGFLSWFDEGIMCKNQALFLSQLNGLIKSQYDILKVLLKINDQNLPFGCTKYCYIPCSNKMPCFACYFELSF
jgi:hypothetical protein